MKRIICAAVVSIIMIGGASAHGAPSVSAASAILVDAASGRVLYEKDADTPRLIASTTKLMTALTAVESGRALDEVVTICPEWTGIEGSSIYLKSGEQLTLETLLYGMLLRSGNDAAHAVAGYCGGEVEAFVSAMNAKADALGMVNTSFENPSGLDGVDHHSTARDMALLARACLSNQWIKTIVSTKSATCEGRVFTNHNKLLWRYEGCVGLKTGYTEKAGRTLVSAAERDGMTLICVTLNAPSDWADHTALLDYGFSNYRPRCLLKAGEKVGWLAVKESLVSMIPISSAGDIWVAVSDKEQVEIAVEPDGQWIKAPVYAGTQVGTGLVQIEGKEILRFPVCTPCTIHKDSVFEKTGLLKRILGG